MSTQENLTRIKVVYDALGDLAGTCVFVGGATVSLYSERPSSELRPTDDVDIIVELLNYGDYAEIEERLRGKGFINDTSSGVVCRYIIHGVIVDIMPTDSSVLGFSNPWYRPGFHNAISLRIDPHYEIRILTPAYFIATKLAAFYGRGNNDGRTSSDFEDIIYIINTRRSIFSEMKEAPQELRTYLAAQFRILLNVRYFEEWVSSHLDYVEQRRVTYILGGLEEFVRG